MARLAAPALGEILTEYLEELEERDPIDVRSVEEITAELATFIAARVPADEETADEQW